MCVGVSLTGVFVIACRSVGADGHRASGRGAPGSVCGRAARGTCLLSRSQEQKQSDHETRHTLPPVGSMASADCPADTCPNRPAVLEPTDLTLRPARARPL